MGMWKLIATDIAEDKKNTTENKIDMVDVVPTIICVVFVLFSVYLFTENEKLLKQVDYAMGKYNEVSYQADLINNAYEDLQKEYERLVDVIKTSDKYEMPEGMEE